jgi:hypothetical protein
MIGSFDGKLGAIAFYDSAARRLRPAVKQEIRCHLHQLERFTFAFYLSVELCPDLEFPKR